MDWKQRTKSGICLTGLAQESSCEFGNELSGSIKRKKKTIELLHNW
jgi:hypothetical protein